MEVWTVWREEIVGEVPIFKGVFSSLEKAREWANTQEGGDWGYILARPRVLDIPIDTSDPDFIPGFPRPIELRCFHAERREALHVRLSNMKPVEFTPLLPASSVNDAFGPPVNPTTKGLLDWPLRVASSYRGHSMYLENGAFVYRADPRGECANGYCAVSTEPETCYVQFRGASWEMTLEFV